MRKNKLLLLLALLLTAATGAWAQEPATTYSVKKLTVPDTWTGDMTTFSAADLPSDFAAVGDDVVTTIPAPTATGNAVLIYGFSGGETKYVEYANGVQSATDSRDFLRDHIYGYVNIMGYEGVYYTAAAGTSATYSVKMKDGVKDADKWTVKVGEGQAQALPIGGLKGDGSETVTLQYTGRLKVKGVTATSDEKPAGPPSWKLTLSSPAKDLCIIAKGGVIAQQTLDVASTEFTVEMPELTSQTVNIFATDGSGNCWYCTQENISFAIGQTYQSSPTMTALDEDNSKPLYKITATSDVTIPDGKTVVLSGVNISGGSITCDGSVTMILMGANTVTATDNNAAIEIGGPGTTLTITGSGSLTAQGGLEAAGIGTDRIENDELSFGNIVINGGTVTATGGDEGAGIGTGLAQGEFHNTSITCGYITINGGTVTAIGGLYGAGIGTGPTMSDGGSASITCGDITINGGTVTAIGGIYGAGIGTGTTMSDGGSAIITCGDITINGGTVTATGGGFGPGIGTGVFLKYGGETTSNGCGAITIGAGVTSVTATKGSGSPNSIGKGYAYGGTQNYGTITIGGDATTYAAGVTTSPFTYTPSN